jgi:hypothetical protein
MNAPADIVLDTDDAVIQGNPWTPTRMRFF